MSKMVLNMHCKTLRIINDTNRDALKPLLPLKFSIDGKLFSIYWL